MKHIIHAPHLSRLTDEQKEAIYAKAREESVPIREGPAVIRVVSLWEELHRRALIVTGDDSAFLTVEFARRLPCGDCRRHWFEMLERTPPDFSRYFEWTVDRHNEVSARIGKPIISHEEARWIWA